MGVFFQRDLIPPLEGDKRTDLNALFELLFELTCQIKRDCTEEYFFKAWKTIKAMDNILWDFPHHFKKDLKS